MSKKQWKEERKNSGQCAVSSLQEKTRADARYQISGKTRAKKQQKQKAKKLSNVFEFKLFAFAENCPNDEL
ncbi:MAG: hypothetical protein C0604_07450 [Clostridiales bacterium]|nr:MAG: hypothetical protein C0604_07450 [Clostridiales bacterium]